MDLADFAATDQAAAQPSAWEVLQASPKARPVVRDLRAAPAPDLPAVEVLRSTESAPKPPQPTPLVPGPSAQARVQARLAQASGAQQPAAAAATGAATAAALSEADDEGDEAPHKLDDEPLWDMDGLEFPDAEATAGPVHEEVEAMAQAFAQEMEAGGALGLGGTRAAAAPVAPSLAPTQRVEAVQDVVEPAAIAPAKPAQAVPAGADMDRDDGDTDAPASRAATPSAAAQTPPKPAAERELEHDGGGSKGDGEAGAPAADHVHLQDGADDTADVGDVEGAAPAQKEEKHPAVPEFMKQAQRKAWWNQPAVRFVMGMLVMLLPLALALQIVVQERNALAAWQPQWRPALENLCVALDCTLAPRQDIAAVVVADSHFAATGAPFAYQLELALHNRSGAAVAMPALEVTLTDSQEQVLVRKVLQPQDLGAPTELGPRAEWALKLPVTTQGLHLPVSGYRLTVFYP